MKFKLKKPNWKRLNFNYDLNITPKRVLLWFVFACLVVTILLAHIELRRLRHEIYWVQHNIYGWGNSYDPEDEIKKVTHKVISQEVKELEVVDSYGYEGNDETTYKTEKVRILKIEVTNNTDWLYSSYSFQPIDKDGRVIYSGLQLKEDSEEYETSMKDSSFELAPGGKTTLTLYFEDDGAEITRLYDSNSSEFIDIEQ